MMPIDSPNAICDFITGRVGLPESVWREHRDLCYLEKCAETFCAARADYARYTYRVVEPRLHDETQRDRLLALLLGLAESADAAAAPDTDLHTAQAIEIVANDFWLLQKMRQGGATPESIARLTDGIDREALDVGERLLANAVRQVRAVQHVDDSTLDARRIVPLASLNLPSDSATADIMPMGASTIHLIVNAGRSTRLRTTIPKGVLYLHDQPLIRYTIDAGRRAGAQATLVVLGFRKDLNAQFLPDGIPIVTQPAVGGTAHAVMSAAAALARFRGTLLMSYSDMPFITSETLGRLLAQHRESGDLFTLLTTASVHHPDYGVLTRDESKSLLRIAQPRIETTRTAQADAGFYCLQCPEIWPYLGQIENRNNRYEYYLTDIVAALSARGLPISICDTQDTIETLGINQPADLLKALEIAHFEFAQGISRSELIERYEKMPGDFRDELLAFYCGFRSSYVFPPSMRRSAVAPPNSASCVDQDVSVLDCVARGSSHIGCLFTL